MDKISIKLLNALYKKDLDESEVNKIIGRLDNSQPDERLSFLLREKLITHHEDGEPDPEGGLIEGTVTRTYRILPAGRAFVEQIENEHKNKWLDRLSNLIP